MIINSIELQNYRVHKNISIDFSKGINLLLGDNGKGKSSILEAIGVTLFGSSFRDGNSKGQQQCISYGEKEALVKIEFVGNDGDIYIIENQIKKAGGYNKLYRKLDPSDKLSSKDEITDKLRLLVGIDGELKDIYDNIIVAKQNEFINSFKLKATERQKVFDRILNTDIYRDIYEGQAKKTFDNYKNKFGKDQSFLEGLRQNLEDITLLSENSKEKKKELEEKKLILVNKLENQKEIVKSLEEIKVLKNILDTYENNIKNTEKLLLSKKEEIEKNKINIEKAKKSLEIVNKNEVAYSEFIELTKEYDEQNKITEELFQKVKAYNEKELYQKELLNKKEIVNNNINTIKINIENQKIKEEELRNILLDLEKDLKDKEGQKKNFETNIKELSEKLKSYEELYRKKEELKNLYNNSKIIFEKNAEDFEKLNIKISEVSVEALNKEIENLKKIEKEKSLLLSEISALETRILDNEEAKKQLKSSLCPFLQETCKNLQGQDVGGFFEEKDKNLKTILLNSKNSLAEKEKSLESLKKLEFSLKEYENIGRETETKKIIIEKDKKELDFLEKSLELENFKLESFIKENGSGEFIGETLTVAKIKLSSLKIEESIKEIKTKKENLELILANIKAFAEKEEKEKAKLCKILEEIKTVEALVEELRVYPEKFEKEKKKLQKISEDKEKIKDLYEEYLANEPFSKELDNYINLSQILGKDLETLEKELKEIKNFFYEKTSELKTKENFDILKEKEKNIKEEIEEFNKILGALEQNIKILSEKIEKAKETQNIIRDKEQKLMVLEKKIQLTEKFRKNIKDMGIRVTENILKEISFWATDNFVKITGRTERISWSNEENPYEVSLVGEKKVSFEQLSGGEQVAVAISLRAAMASIFTKTNFSIFDEPTNNLDKERKKSLADNIGEILKNLEQSIIVTHDDSFREMAEKVIEL